MQKYTIGACVLVALALITFQSCTSSSIGDGGISGGRRTVSGNVVLTNGSGTFSAEGAFVWLSGMDISTRSDAQGHFELSLPPPAAQPGQGLSGAFKLYFYVDNFGLGITDALIDEGEFIFDTDEIGSNGALRRPMELVQTFTVTASMTPASFEIDEIPVLISARFSLRAVGKPIDVFFPRQVDDITGPVIVRNKETGTVKIISSTITGPGGLNDILTISSNTDFERIVAIPTAPLQDFTIGTYEFIPFLYSAATVPPELLANLGDSARQLGVGYLDLPLVRNAGELKVTPDTGE